MGEISCPNPVGVVADHYYTGVSPETYINLIDALGYHELTTQTKIPVGSVSQDRRRVWILPLKSTYPVMINCDSGTLRYGGNMLNFAATLDTVSKALHQRSVVKSVHVPVELYNHLSDLYNLPFRPIDFSARHNAIISPSDPKQHRITLSCPAKIRTQLSAKHFRDESEIFVTGILAEISRQNLPYGGSQIILSPNSSDLAAIEDGKVSHEVFQHVGMTGMNLGEASRIAGSYFPGYNDPYMAIRQLVQESGIITNEKEPAYYWRGDEDGWVNPVEESELKEMVNQLKLVAPARNPNGCGDAAFAGFYGSRDLPIEDSARIAMLTAGLVYCLDLSNLGMLDPKILQQTYSFGTN